MSISVKNMEKKEIRKKVLDIRNKLPETVRREKSIRIAEAVCKTSCFQEASSILVYCHFRSEAETDCLMEKAWEMGKKVYCPRVEGKEMEFYRIRSRRDLESGSFGIREPGLHCQVFDEREEHLPLVILPGAVFDWNRIGSDTVVDFMTGIWRNIQGFELRPSVLKSRCRKRFHLNLSISDLI